MGSPDVQDSQVLRQGDSQAPGQGGLAGARTLGLASARTLRGNSPVFTRWLPAEVRGDSQVLGQGAAAPAGSLSVLEDRDSPGAGGAGGPLTITASVESEDRAGDLILASGWDLRGYEANPVVLWAHQHLALPIGRSLRTWVEGRALLATVEFAPSPFAQEVRRLYVGGFLRGVSVGFRALETEPRQAGKGGRRGTLFKRQELLEISAAPVPLHPDTLAAPERDGAAGWPGRRYDADASPEGQDEVVALREIRRLWEDIGAAAGVRAAGLGGRPGGAPVSVSRTDPALK